MKTIEEQIKDAQKKCRRVNFELEHLINKQQQYPYMIEKAEELAKYGYSEALIQSKLYASRGDSISIDDIAEIAKKAILKFKSLKPCQI